ncbi:flagellar protein FliT [Desnuesiella massiliensis]|uniref:flagellar protein FliT n=1 Tax=Desnuesiella massiliensis TaxID=1650662 RepID=UPI00093B52CA|nr:flagellar protein FliT [Desnuesiella massiliensis]
MDKLLEESLIEFKSITLDLINALEYDDFDKLESLIEKRQAIINILEKANYAEEEFKHIASSIDLLTLQKKVLDLMNSKKVELRSEMDKLSEIKTANKSYNSKFAVDSVYFNKKI